MHVFCLVYFRHSSNYFIKWIQIKRAILDVWHFFDVFWHLFSFSHHILHRPPSYCTWTWRSYRRQTCWEDRHENIFNNSFSPHCRHQFHLPWDNVVNCWPGCYCYCHVILIVIVMVFKNINCHRFPSHVYHVRHWQNIFSNHSVRVLKK